MDQGTGVRLRKVCPQCSTVIHARRSVCECGHAFTLKREARITASSPAKRKRALESLEDTLRRQESNRTRMASMRASETQEQTLERLEQNRTRIASMTASETCTGKVLLPVTKGNILKLVLMYFTKCSVLIIHTLALVAKSGFVRPVIEH